jgi:hypothetical protein
MSIHIGKVKFGFLLYVGKFEDEAAASAFVELHGFVVCVEDGFSILIAPIISIFIRGVAARTFKLKGVRIFVEDR